MTHTEHAPTPWKVFYAKNNGQLILGVGEDNGQGVIASDGSFWGNDEEAKLNSEHVVKCVNVHDDLLEALEVVARNPHIGHDLRQMAQIVINKAKGN